MCNVEYTIRNFLLDRYKGSMGEVRLLGFFAQALYLAEHSYASRILSIVGICSMITGHFFRIGSMFHAASSFNHLVQTKKAQGHQLVKTGPYRFSRHPSYFGWFLWATGTQLMLSNYICYGLWAYACYSFFSDRIPYEEYHLVKFFG